MSAKLRMDKLKRKGGMRQIVLQQRWYINEAERLGPAGGFGAVFSGKGENSADVAIKEFHVTSGAEARELKMADYLVTKNYPHVIPIYDCGKDRSSGKHYIVMARADQSLQDLITKSAPLAEPAALEILAAIADGLEEIENVVHRDLKPGNVLFHGGIWKLADMGLARFLEDSTSLQTMKGFLSPQYAAPEQWKEDPVTKETDLYAFGCIAYTLLTGRPPFLGPEMSDYKRQHQLESPPPLTASPRLRNLVTTCLQKNPKRRPLIQSVRAQIQRARSDHQALQRSVNPLLDVAANIREQEARAEAAKEAEQKAIHERRALAFEAAQSLQKLFHDIVTMMNAEVPNLQIETKQRNFEQPFSFNATEYEISLGKGRIVLAIPHPFLERLKISAIEPHKWDVVSGGMIGTISTWHRFGGENRPGLYSSPSRSANLWFGKLTDDDRYRWWEVSFMYGPKFPLSTGGLGRPHPPFCVGDQYEPYWAGVPVTLDQLGFQGWLLLATNPKPIDDEYFDDFYSRWSRWFAEFAADKYEINPPLPEEIEQRFTCEGE